MIFRVTCLIQLDRVNVFSTHQPIEVARISNDLQRSGRASEATMVPKHQQEAASSSKMRHQSKHSRETTTTKKKKHGRARDRQEVREVSEKEEVREGARLTTKKKKHWRA